MRVMKYINKMFVTAGLITSLGLTSCDDYLTVLPTDKITEQDFWKDKNDLDNVRAAAYRQFATADVISRVIYWGELRADNFTLNKMDQTNILNLQQAVLMPTDGMFDWSAFYTGINFCNQILDKGEKMTEPGNEVDPSFRRNDWNTIKAEIVSLRALYYFYLVKAYRDVPYVTESITTDEQAMRSHIPATSGVNLLGYLIKDIEDLKAQNIVPAIDYGNTQDNLGRITRRSMYALLADMNLWRACMLMNSEAKNDIVLGEEGDTLSSSACTNLSNDCLRKAIEYSDLVLKEFNDDYLEYIDKYPFSTKADNKDKRYPYLTRFNFSADENAIDYIYSQLWATRYSDECVFQLNYDGNSIKNGAYGTYYSYVEGGLLRTGNMTGASALVGASATDVNPQTGFGKADLRVAETFKYSSTSNDPAQFHKGLARSIIIEDMKDVSLGCDASWTTTQDMPWPIYRLTDIMLIKAEAIARLYPTRGAATDNADGKLVNEGFLLVNTIFERNNPKLFKTGEGNDEEYICDRLDDDYALAKTGDNAVAAKTGADLLSLLYQERQREFVGEGKRWFDIVRQVEASNNSRSTLSDYISLSTSVRNRLRLLYAMYVPIYSEEMKINGVGKGGYLVQNPVWDRYTSEKDK